MLKTEARAVDIGRETADAETFMRGISPRGPRLMIGLLHEAVSGMSGGAAAERDARSAARDVKASAGGLAPAGSEQEREAALPAPVCGPGERRGP